MEIRDKSGGSVKKAENNGGTKKISGNPVNLSVSGAHRRIEKKLSGVQFAVAHGLGGSPPTSSLVVCTEMRATGPESPTYFFSRE